MRYKIIRIANNDNNWQGPSGKRLGKEGFGDYVKEHGFGHEDWNFDARLEENGFLLGYTAAQVAAGSVGETFGVILAVYEDSRWYAVGYYELAESIKHTKPTDRAITQITSDLHSLAEDGELADEYRTMTFDDMRKEVIRTFRYFNWKVPSSGVRKAKRKLPLSEEDSPNGSRMRTAYNLNESVFLSIKAKIDEKTAASPFQKGEEDYAEGGVYYQMHRKRERNRKLVRDFKAQLSNFSCSICMFDFEAAYGELGQKFIECHHTKPIADMKIKSKTKIEDLVAVCSNCHRMIHRQNPPLAPAELRKLMRKGS